MCKRKKLDPHKNVKRGIEEGNRVLKNSLTGMTNVSTFTVTMHFDIDCTRLIVSKSFYYSQLFLCYAPLEVEKMIPRILGNYTRDHFLSPTSSDFRSDFTAIYSLTDFRILIYSK